jgi:hypothetical protein
VGWRLFMIAPVSRRALVLDIIVPDSSAGPRRRFEPQVKKRKAAVRR